MSVRACSIHVRWYSESSMRLVLAIMDESAHVSRADTVSTDPRRAVG